MISTNDIKQLREKTGAGVLDCRDALTRCAGDFNKAVDVLREKGAEVMERRAEREAALAPGERGALSRARRRL